MMKCKFIVLSLLFLISSCSLTTQMRSEYNNLLCTDTQLTRTPSTANQCLILFSDKSVERTDSNYFNELSSNPSAALEASVLKTTSAAESPVKLPAVLEKFRSRFLSFLKNLVTREPLVRSFEASMRMQSLLLENSIRQNKDYAAYDIVLVGSGVHGVIAVNKLMQMNPNLKVLIVEESDTAASNFRYAKEGFNINSSNRASGKGTKPLPGQGNINELPGLPIQISDLTNVKYPTANDLGSAVNIGLYAALREYPNVDVLFNANVTQILKSSKDSRFGESVQITTQKNEDAPLQIDSQKIIISTGLGEAKIPELVRESLAANPDLARSIKGQVPRVVTFEDIMRAIGSSNNPLEIFKNKKIAIAGKGDSANVLIEFLLGYATKDGYALSNAQQGRPQKIFWLGQDKTTCKSFIEDIRSRYQQISTGFRSSDDGLEAIIKAFSPKLKSVYAQGSKLATAALDSGQKVDVDMIVLTTGFEQNIRKLLAEVTNRKSTEYATDSQYFDSEYVETLLLKTSVSAQPTKVGRKMKDREIYILGTAAGELAEKKELVGIIQNFVSIFNNAPRVVAAIERIAQKISPIAKKNMTQTALLTKQKNQNLYVISSIQESRIMPSQTIAFLKSIFNEALSLTQTTSAGRISFSLSLNSKNELVLKADSDYDISQVIRLLAESRDFFSLAQVLLNSNPEIGLKFNSAASNLNFDLAQTSVSIEPHVIIENTSQARRVNNGAIHLRGMSALTSIDPKLAENNKNTRELFQMLALGKANTRDFIASLRNPDLNFDLESNLFFNETLVEALQSEAKIFLAATNPKVDVNRVKFNDRIEYFPLSFYLISAIKFTYFKPTDMTLVAQTLDRLLAAQSIDLNVTGLSQINFVQHYIETLKSFALEGPEGSLSEVVKNPIVKVMQKYFPEVKVEEILKK